MARPENFWPTKADASAGAVFLFCSPAGGMSQRGQTRMPVVDNQAARRDARRAYLKSLKRGDFITCGVSM